MMEKIMKLMDDYEERFGDIFPTMCFQNEPWEQIQGRIEECLKEGKSAEDLYKLNYNYKY